MHVYMFRHVYTSSAGHDFEKRKKTTFTWCKSKIYLSANPRCTHRYFVYIHIFLYMYMSSAGNEFGKG